MGKVLDALLGSVGAININAAIGIGNGSLFQCRNPFVCIIAAPGAMEFFILALQGHGRESTRITRTRGEVAKIRGTFAAKSF
jgi:hypothetical protein